MKILALSVALAAAMSQAASVNRPPTRNVGSMSGQALMLAESANLLMMPGRARDQKQWMADAKLMLDAGAAAVKGAKAKNVEAITAVSDQLLESCTACHRHYRPDYGKPKPAGE